VGAGSSRDGRLDRGPAGSPGPAGSCGAASPSERRCEGAGSSVAPRSSTTASSWIDWSPHRPAASRLPVVGRSPAVQLVAHVVLLVRGPARSVWWRDQEPRPSRALEGQGMPRCRPGPPRSRCRRCPGRTPPPPARSWTRPPAGRPGAGAPIAAPPPFSHGRISEVLPARETRHRGPGEAQSRTPAPPGCGRAGRSSRCSQDERRQQFPNGGHDPRMRKDPAGRPLCGRHSLDATDP
jgi:hypothetical protein